MFIITSCAIESYIFILIILILIIPMLIVIVNLIMMSMMVPVSLDNMFGLMIRRPCR
jgi:hypothetical protein